MQNRHDTTAGKCLDGYPGENGIQLGAVDIVLSHCCSFFVRLTGYFSVIMWKKAIADGIFLVRNPVCFRTGSTEGLPGQMTPACDMGVAWRSGCQQD
jgi:hypothetical protein